MSHSMMLQGKDALPVRIQKRIAEITERFYTKVEHNTGGLIFLRAILHEELKKEFRSSWSTDFVPEIRLLGQADSYLCTRFGCGPCKLAGVKVRLWNR